MAPMRVQSEVGKISPSSLKKILPDVLDNFFEKYKFVIDPLLLGSYEEPSDKNLYKLARKIRRNITRRAVRANAREQGKALAAKDQQNSPRNRKSVSVANNDTKERQVKQKTSTYETKSNFQADFSRNDHSAFKIEFIDTNDDFGIKPQQVFAPQAQQRLINQIDVNQFSADNGFNKQFNEILHKSRAKIHCTVGASLIDKYVDKSFGPYATSLVTNVQNPEVQDWRLFQWKRLSHLYHSGFSINFHNGKVRFLNADLSNPQLLTIFLSLHRFGDMLVKFWVQDYNQQTGKIVLRNSASEDIVQLDDFLPVQLNSASTADFEHFSFPFVSPVHELKEVNPLFCILEKYCAKVAGSYERLAELKFDKLIRLFSAEVEEISISSVRDFDDKQLDNFFEELYMDSKDTSKVLYFYAEGESLKYCKFIKADTKEFLLEDFSVQKNYRLSELIDQFDQIVIGRYYF